MSEESKAYKLYNPVTKKVVISRDVKFIETDKWQWHDSKLNKNLETMSIDMEELKEANTGDSGTEAVTTHNEVFAEDQMMYMTVFKKEKRQMLTRKKQNLMTLTKEQGNHLHG